MKLISLALTLSNFSILSTQSNYNTFSKSTCPQYYEILNESSIYPNLNDSLINSSDNLTKAIKSKNIKLAKNIIEQKDDISFEDKQILLNKKTNIVHIGVYFNVLSVLDDYNKDTLNKKTINNISPLDLAILISNHEAIEQFLVLALEKNDINQVISILKEIEKLENIFEFNDPRLCLFNKCKIAKQLFLKVIQKLNLANPSIALIYALKFLDKESTLELINQNNINTNVQDKNGKTALAYALENNNDDITKEIISKQLALNLELNFDNYKEKGLNILQQILDDALIAKDYNKVSKILNKQIQQKIISTKQIQQILVSALKNQQKELTFNILNLVKKLNLPQVLNFDEPHKLFDEKLENDDLTLELLKVMASLNIVINGWTPLMIALRYQNEKIIFELLKLNSDINAQNKNGWTPLMFALHNQSGKVTEKVMLELLKLNPDLDAKDNDGWTPLMIALRYQNEKIIFELLKLNSDINAQNKNGWTHLMYALRNQSGKVTEKVMLELLKLNPDINAKDNYGWTPLMFALHNQSGKVTEKVMLELLKLNPDINAKDNYGWTPLMNALYNKSGKVTEKVMLELLKLNPDLDAKDKNGWTPLMFAKRYCNSNLIIGILESRFKIKDIKNNEITISF